MAWRLDIDFEDDTGFTDIGSDAVLANCTQIKEFDTKHRFVDRDSVSGTIEIRGASYAKCEALAASGFGRLTARLVDPATGEILNGYISLRGGWHAQTRVLYTVFDQVDKYYDLLDGTRASLRQPQEMILGGVNTGVIMPGFGANYEFFVFVRQDPPDGDTFDPLTDTGVEALGNLVTIDQTYAGNALGSHRKYYVCGREKKAFQSNQPLPLGWAAISDNGTSIQARRPADISINNPYTGGQDYNGLATLGYPDTDNIMRMYADAHIAIVPHSIVYIDPAQPNVIKDQDLQNHDYVLNSGEVQDNVFSIISGTETFVEFTTGLDTYSRKYRGYAFVAPVQVYQQPATIGYQIIMFGHSTEWLNTEGRVLENGIKLEDWITNISDITQVNNLWSGRLGGVYDNLVLMPVKDLTYQDTYTERTYDQNPDRYRGGVSGRRNGYTLQPNGVDSNRVADISKIALLRSYLYAPEKILDWLRDQFNVGWWMQDGELYIGSTEDYVTGTPTLDFSAGLKRYFPLLDYNLEAIPLTVKRNTPWVSAVSNTEEAIDVDDDLDFKGLDLKYPNSFEGEEVRDIEVYTDVGTLLRYGKKIDKGVIALNCTNGSYERIKMFFGAKSQYVTSAGVLEAEIEKTTTSQSSRRVISSNSIESLYTGGRVSLTLIYNLVANVLGSVFTLALVDGDLYDPRGSREVGGDNGVIGSIPLTVSLGVKGVTFTATRYIKNPKLVLEFVGAYTMSGTVRMLSSRSLPEIITINNGVLTDGTSYNGQLALTYTDAFSMQDHPTGTVTINGSGKTVQQKKHLKKIVPYKFYNTEKLSSFDLRLPVSTPFGEAKVERLEKSLSGGLTEINAAL